MEQVPSLLEKLGVKSMVLSMHFCYFLLPISVVSVEGKSHDEKDMMLLLDSLQ
jgi:hypothetical protein